MLYYLQRLSKRLTQRTITRPQLQFAALWLGVWLAGNGAAMAQVTISGSPTNYATIQAAIDAATAGATINVSAGTYDELVTVNKSLTILGSGASSIVTYTGPAIVVANPVVVSGTTTPTLFKVTAANVTIQNLTMNVDLSKLRSAIHTSGKTTNLTIIGNVITPSGTPGNNYGIRNAIAINPSLTNNGYTFDGTGFSGVVVKGNTVNVSTGGILNSFRAALQMDWSSGTIGGSTAADGNTFTGLNHDVNVRYANQGAVTIQHNTCNGGGIQLTEPKSGGGAINIADNILTGTSVQPSTGALGTGALMRIQSNLPGLTVSVSNNTFSDYRWGMSVENFNTITLNGNTFTPRANSTDYRSISFNTKLLSSTSAGVVPVNIGATLTNNIFNGSGTTGGTAIAFFNHRQSGGTPAIGTYTLGTAGNENSFNAGIATFLRLDNSTGPSSGFVSPFDDYVVAGAPSTTMNYWTPNLNAVNNKFDVGTGLKLAANLTDTDRTALNGQLFDKSDDANVGRISYFFPVQNVTQNLFYETIQLAVDAATAGDVINAAAGTYDELVVINKGLTVQGQGASSIVTFTGTVPGSALASLFTVAAANVTIQNLNFTVDLSKTHSAIHTTGNDRTNLHVIGNIINPVGVPAGGTYGRRNAIAINPNITIPNYVLDSDGFGGIVVQSNTVTAGSSGLANSFRAAVQFDLGGGLIGGATASLGNSLTAINHDFVSVFANQGDLTVQNNTFGGGGVQISDPNPNAGTITVSNNTLDGSFVQPATGALGTGALMRLRNNGVSGVKTLVVQNNTFTNQRWGISSENNAAITISGNTFTPNPAATDFRHISINSKLIASNSASLTDAQMQTLNATLTGNTFNGASTPGSGTAVAFLNHRTQGAKFGTFTLGTLGNENVFNAGIGTFVTLDNSTGASTAYAGPLGDYAGVPATNMGPWAVDVSGTNNKFDVGTGAKTPLTMTNAERVTLETKLFHKPDDVTVGRILDFFPVRNVTQSLSYTAIQPAIDAANANDVIELAEYTFKERANVTKPLTLSGVSKTGTILDGTGLSAGNGITLQDNVAGITIKNLTIKKQTGAANATGNGIYGKTNGNLTITGVSSVSNATHGIILETSGTLTGVSITSSTLSSNGIGAGGRGFIIFNNLKQNITVSNNLLENNGLTGIDFNEGTATGVSITNNTATSNGDEGIGLLGALATGGANVISGNTLTNNGHYGLEVKSSVGTGATSGAGSLVIENNIISRTVDFPGSRDIAGISVTRRGATVSVNTVETPQGAVVRNNTVTGYINSGGGDGFGIVVEGTNYQVTGNTVSGNDVGIQEQRTPKGQRGRTATGQPNDGDSPYDVSDYFDRGNSIVSCGTVTGNTTTGNTLATRQVGGAGGSGLVTNTTTNATFCSIQAAVDAASAGQTLSVGAGTYDEQVLVNKSVTIRGSGMPKPVVNFTGTATGKPALFDISADGVVIQNLRFIVDLSKLRSAIIASAAGIDNIGVINNIVDAYGTPAGSYGDRNAININYGTYRVATGGVNSITATGNTINGTGTSFFRAGIVTDEAGGTFSDNAIQTINQDIQVRFGSNGAITVANNMINGGGVELADMNAAAGQITVTGNTFNGLFGSAYSSSLRLKNNVNAIPTTVSGNTFTGHNQGVSLENYQTVSVNNNTFTPATGSTMYRHVTVNTKEFSSSSGTFAPVVSLTLLGNTFTGSSSPTSGTALVFANQDNDNPTFGPFVVGTMGQENTFAASLGTFIALDGSTGTVNQNATQAAPFAIDINIGDNKFDVGSGLQLPENMSGAGQTVLETKLLHKPDNAALGRLLYACVAPTIVASATGVCAGSSVTLTASGAASYTWSTGETTASITVMPTSTTTVSLTATTVNGCVSTTAVTITVNNAPTMPTLTPASSTLTCANTSVTLTASATGGASYTLLGGSASQSNTTGQFVVSMAGTYTAIIANASGCTATATATVTSNTAVPTATLTASTNPVCAPNSVTITAGGTGTSYTFSAGATQIGSSNQAIVTQSGTYSVTVSNASGCTATASTSVTVNTPPAAPTLTAVSRTVNANNTPLPLGQFVNATGSNTLSFSGVNGLLNPPNANISTGGVQNFSVTQTDANGCVSAATPFMITVVATPTSQSVCRSSTVVLNALTTGVRYEWYKNGTAAPFKLTEIASIQKGTKTESLTIVSIQTSAPYYVKVFQANGSFTVDGPFQVTVNYGCIAPGARVAASEVVEVPLSVVLTPNPVVDGQLRAVVRGAAGVSLSVELVDLKGQLIRSQKWQAAETEQTIEWNMGNGPSGLYLLRAQTTGESTTVKVIKQ